MPVIDYGEDALVDTNAGKNPGLETYRLQTLLAVAERHLKTARSNNSAGHAALDRIARFLGGLDLNDHPIAVQREARELLYEAAQLLRTTCAVTDTKADAFRRGSR